MHYIIFWSFRILLVSVLFSPLLSSFGRLIFRDDTMFAKSNQSEPVCKNNVNSRSISESKSKSESESESESGTSDCHSIATSKESTSAQRVATQTFSLRFEKQKEVVQSLEMSMKMKGLLKGLRYISHIFENGKEEEMQIGYPTDVKHVAHIGWDGSSTQSPKWMNEFSNGDANKSNLTGASLEDVHRTGAGIDGSRRDLPGLPKPSRRQPFLSTSTSVRSPRSDQPKESRRHQSTAGILTNSPSRDAPGISTNSPSRDTSERSSKPSRRSQNAGLSMDSSSQDQKTDPKKSRRKSKGSSGGGSTRPSRSKAQSTTTYTSPFSGPGSVCVVNNEVCPKAALE